MNKKLLASKFDKCANNFQKCNMMEEFYQWYSRNQDAISWFLIGAVSVLGVVALNRGEYFWAAWHLLIAFINYKFIPTRA